MTLTIMWLLDSNDPLQINVYKNKKLYGQVNIAEPIKDMAVYSNLVFTVKDLDLVVTEIKLEGMLMSIFQLNNIYRSSNKQTRQHLCDFRRKNSIWY